MEEENKKQYEISFLLESEEDLKVIEEKINFFKGEILERGELKRINLAYPIAKRNEALFGFLKFLAEPATIDDLSKELRLEGRILRFLIVIDIFPKVSQTKEKKPPEKQKAPKVKEKPAVTPKVITNEELEKKLEEILS
ncbi:MAG: 30S ribosomal protein S6 [Patescibacteria group bacterium]|nr:30S ribosomal protein S6 [Patescibacteria group bacterium]